jgi:transposase
MAQTKPTSSRAMAVATTLAGCRCGRDGDSVRTAALVPSRRSPGSVWAGLPDAGASHIPKRPGDRVKTDRRDAASLARLHRAGELTAVWVPDVGHEAMRDLVRARLDAVHTLRRARQQLSGFLLRQRCHYGRPAWTKLHRRWLAGLRFEQAAHHLVLEDYIQTVEAAATRRDRLTAQIEAMLPDWTLAPVVAALQTMRGMALVNAATLVAELGDLSRFANPRQLMAYLGLVPSEHSSGASVRRGGITKAGSSAARRLYPRGTAEIRRDLQDLGPVHGTIRCVLTTLMSVI